MKKTSLLVRGSALTLALFSAMPAFAQGATDCVDADSNGVCDSEESGAIVVTGSRIRQPNLESANPIAVVTGDEIFETGGISVGVPGNVAMMKLAHRRHGRLAWKDLFAPAAAFSVLAFLLLAF